MSGLDTMTKASSVNALAIQSFLEKAFDSTPEQRRRAECYLGEDGYPACPRQARCSRTSIRWLKRLQLLKKMATESVAGAAAYAAALKAEAAVDEAYKKVRLVPSNIVSRSEKLNLELG